MDFKKTIAALSAAAMLLSLAACAKSEAAAQPPETETETAEETDYAGKTLTGQITALDETSLTLQLGTWETDSQQAPDGSAPAQPPQSGTSAPEKPDENTQAAADPEEAAQGEDAAAPASEAQADDPAQPGGQTPPEKPEGDDAVSGQTPPEKPEGDTATSGQTPPEKPEGDSTASGQTPHDMPEGSDAMGSGMPSASGSSGQFQAEDETVTLDLSQAVIELTENGETVSGSLEDLAVGSIVTVEVSEAGTATRITLQSSGSMPSAQPGGGFGGSDTVTQGSAATTLDTDQSISDTTYVSSGDDENALRVDGAAVTLQGVTVDKQSGSSSNTENGDFYGVNAALLATNGADVTIENATVTSSAQNGNGVFSYGSGTCVTISDSSITTTADNSGGIQTTGGATTHASNLTVETSGNSSAAIRSDRGGGTVTVDGGTYQSNGLNSPAVYSTAAIQIQDATLLANRSEALVIEGQNSITLENCTVQGNMSDTEGASSDENVHNVMIYQSMSGDADVGTSTFSMQGGSLTAKNGDMFYVTNTHCILSLCGVTLSNEDPDGYLLRVVGNSASHGWGSAGSNGAQVEFTASAQTLEGNILVDTISSLSLTLCDQSSFTGTICIAENEQGGSPVSENAVVTIEEGSTWNLTGDCTLTSLENHGTICFNGYTITLADGTVLQ